MSRVYRVGYNAQPSDIDGAPGWYWTDDEGGTHGPYLSRENAEESIVTRQQAEGMDSMLGALIDWLTEERFIVICFICGIIGVALSFFPPEFYQ